MGAPPRGTTAELHLALASTSTVTGVLLQLDRQTRPLPAVRPNFGSGSVWPNRRSPELLGQPDHDPLRTAHEAEAVNVLVLRDLADQFRAVAAQAGNHVVDVVDGEHDAAYAQRVRRRVLRLGS